MSQEVKTIRWLSRLSFIAVCITYLVIGFGVFTRLTGSGLGCPDWPACYGRIMVSQQYAASLQVDFQKAMIEMGHRAIAGALGMLVMAVILLCVMTAAKSGVRFIIFALSLFLLLMYQVLLGMWTVTLKLSPVVVTQHLFIGMVLLSLLWLIHLHARQAVLTTEKITTTRTIRLLSVISLILFLAQIILGGWTSSHYAGLICQGFIACHPIQLLTSLDITRMLIQMMHRWGAFIVSCALLLLFLSVQFSRLVTMQLKRTSWFLLIALFVQIILGILNVRLKLPLFIAIAHNLTAATLLLVLVTMCNSGKVHDSSNTSE